MQLITPSPLVIPSAVRPLVAPSRNTWLVSADESGVGGQQFYGFGSLWMPWERRGDFHGDFMAIRRQHGMPDDFEVKWSKIDGHVRKAVALALVDWFFRRPWMSFHCLVVRRAALGRGIDRGSLDLLRRKQFVMLLTTKMRRCAELHPDRQNVFRVRVDPIHSSYKKADEAAHVIAGNMLRKMFSEQQIRIESLVTRDSKKTPSIQLCDLLLGAVMDAWQANAVRPEKKLVADAIAHGLGWADLRADTYPSERKLNVWYFWDRKGARPVSPRNVRHLYPLPSRARRDAK